METATVSISDYISGYVKRRLGKWRTVVDFVSITCDAPWYVYVETLGGPLKNAAVTLLDFGWDDVVRGALRPKGVYKKAHLRRRRTKGRGIGIPELGEEIGKRIPGTDALRSRSVGTLERAAWLIDGAVQRALFWLMVADLVTDFAYDWVTGIQQAGYCKDSSKNRVLTEGMGWAFRGQLPGDKAITTGIPSIRWSDGWEPWGQTPDYWSITRRNFRVKPGRLVLTLQMVPGQQALPPLVPFKLYVHTTTPDSRGWWHTEYMYLLASTGYAYTISLDLPAHSYISVWSPILTDWLPWWVDDARIWITSLLIVDR